MLSNLLQVRQQINKEQSEWSAPDRTPEPFPVAFSSTVLLRVLLQTRQPARAQTCGCPGDFGCVSRRMPYLGAGGRG